MKLNEHDILEQRFKEKFRGYDPEEVHTFLKLVAEDFKEFHEQLTDLKSRVEEKDHKISRLETQLKDVLKQISVDPKQAPIIIKDKARQIVNVAKEQANLHKKKVEKELGNLQKDVQKLKEERQELIESIKSSARVFFSSRDKSQDKSGVEDASSN